MMQIASITRTAIKKSAPAEIKGSTGKTVSAAAIRWLLPVAAVALMAFFGVKSSVFFTYGNLMAIATQNAPTFIVAAVFALLLMAGYVDLSVGSLMALVGVCAGLAMNAWGLTAGILVGVAIGVGFGAVNGFLIGLLGFSPIVVTLGGLAAARGLAQYIAQGDVFGFPEAFRIRLGFAGGYSQPGSGCRVDLHSEHVGSVLAASRAMDHLDWCQSARGFPGRHSSQSDSRRTLHVDRPGGEHRRAS
jgi:hypothetical protein